MSDYPKDWEEVKLDNVVDIFDNSRIPVSKDKRIAGNIPYYGANGIQDYVSGYTHDGEFVLLAEDGANNIFEYPVIYTAGKIWVNNHAHVISGMYGVMSTIFLSYILKKVNYEEILVGGTRLKLNGKVLRNIKIVLPPLVEQKTIADTLMIFDKHIENLEKLIEKKKMIRDGAVEDLMTGKTRLNGFDGEWEEVKLEDVCNDNGMVRGPFGGSLKKEYFVNKGYKVYEQRNAIYKSVDIGNYYIDFNKFEELKRFKLKENDFIISCSGTIGEIYQIPKKFKKGIINQALLKISINNNLCDLTFFKNYFSWEKFKSKIIDDTQGGAMKNLVGMDKFRKTRLYIPTDIKEQEAIASILTSMDDEIENLEKEKAKIEKVKAGAMDDLLTGRVRLI